MTTTVPQTADQPDKAELARRAEMLRRREVIAGLRELANFLAANPDVPTPNRCSSIQHSVLRWRYNHGAPIEMNREQRYAEGERVAALLGLPLDEDTVRRTFRGGIQYVVHVDPEPDPAPEPVESPVESAAIVDANLRAAGIFAPDRRRPELVEPSGPPAPPVPPRARKVLSHTHADCDPGARAGQEVTCDRCHRTFVVSPSQDFYCAAEGDHCCEPCLIGDRQLVIIPSDEVVTGPAAMAGETVEDEVKA